MNARFAIVLTIFLIEGLIVFGWMKDFVIFTLSFLGATIPITFSQAILLWSVLVLFASGGGGRGRK